MKDLILIIDMQNVYGPGGQWCCPAAERASGQIRKLIDARLADTDIVFTRFLAPQDPKGIWQQYNLENSQVNEDPYSNEMMACFGEDVKKYPLYTKDTYSSLTIPEVAEAVAQVREAGGKVIVAGVVAECCVLATVMGLIDAGNLVIYLTDAVAGIDRTTEAAVETVLAGLEPLHVRRMTVDDLIVKEKE